MDFFNNIPDTLDIGDRTGWTQYIDFLKREEVPQNMMKGIDIFGRKFITLKVGIMKDSGKLFKTGQVFFQRYTGGNIWMGAVFEGKFIFTDGGMTSEQFDLIDKIVKGKKVVLDADFYPIEFYQGGIIALMDVWEETFAKVIQRNFIIARYNPNYRICKNVLMRQYDEYELQINKYI